MLVGIGQYEYFHWIIWRGQFITGGLVVFILADSGASIYSLCFQAPVDLLWCGPAVFRGLHKTGYFFVTLVKPTFYLVDFKAIVVRSNKLESKDENPNLERRGCYFMTYNKNLFNFIQLKIII